MNQFLEEQYKNLGISREVYEFGEKIEESLKERFAEIDARAEYNQMKVIKAMQENRVSAECGCLLPPPGISIVVAPLPSAPKSKDNIP